MGGLRGLIGYMSKPPVTTGEEGGGGRGVREGGGVYMCVCRCGGGVGVRGVEGREGGGEGGGVYMCVCRCGGGV